MPVVAVVLALVVAVGWLLEWQRVGP